MFIQLAKWCKRTLEKDTLQVYSFWSGQTGGGQKSHPPGCVSPGSALFIISEP